jgi:hypothetical protein
MNSFPGRILSLVKVPRETGERGPSFVGNNQAPGGEKLMIPQDETTAFSGLNPEVTHGKPARVNTAFVPSIENLDHRVPLTAPEKGRGLLATLVLIAGSDLYLLEPHEYPRSRDHHSISHSMRRWEDL